MILIGLCADAAAMTDNGPRWIDDFHLGLDFASALPVGCGGNNRLVVRITLRDTSPPDSHEAFQMAFRTTVFGGDVLEFATQLHDLQRHGTGTATLLDWERRDLLRLSMSVERYPTVLVGGDWDVLIGSVMPLNVDEAYVDWHDFGQGPRMGIFAVFQGLLLHVDALENLRTSLHDMLQKTKVTLSRDW